MTTGSSISTPPWRQADISLLLSDAYKWDPEAEAPIASSQLIERLPGEPWKGAATD